MELLTLVAEAAAPAKSPNLWGALGCALAYSGALFATIDAFADLLLARGDAGAVRLSPALRLKAGSKVAAAGITVVSAGVVLALDANWFAFTTLTIAFIVLVGLAALVLVRQRAHERGLVAEFAPVPAGIGGGPAGTATPVEGG